MTFVRLLVVLAGLLSLTSATPAAQSSTTYTARLSPVPVDATTQPKTTGSGTLTATLRGATLTLKGTFKGLQGAATVARIHVAPRGLRGPAALDVTVSAGTSGTIEGSLTLTAAQLDHLRRGRLYIQIHSEAAPDGNLWGWLLP